MEDYFLVGDGINKVEGCGLEVVGWKLWVGSYELKVVSLNITL